MVTQTKKKAMEFILLLTFVGLVCMIATRRKPGIRPNRLIVGATQYGKTTSEGKDLISAALRGEYAIVVCDPQGSLVNQMIPHIITCKLGGRTLFDFLDYNKKTLGFGFLKPPKYKDPRERRKAIDFIARSSAEVFTRRREGYLLSDHVLTEEWTIGALKLHLSQKVALPAFLLPYAFEPGTKQFEKYLEGCTDDDLYRKFSSLENMSPREVRERIEPARRLFEVVCRCPAFEDRCHDSFDLYDFLKRKGILLLSGQHKGHLSDDAIRTVLGMVITEVIQAVKWHYGVTDKPLKVILAIDEATNYLLFGEEEAKACLTTQKAGLSIDCLVQSLDFGSLDILSKVFQGFTERHWYNCTGPTAEMGAIDVGIPVFDPKREVERQTRTVAIPMGQDRKVEWCGSLERAVERTEQRYEYETVDNVKYMSAQDQMMEARQKLGEQDKGDRMRYRDGKVFKEYARLMNKPRLPLRRIRKFFEKMWERPVYRKPQIIIPKTEKGGKCKPKGMD